MPVKYGKFEMPEKIKVEEADQTKNFARFVVEPFERGFGHTVGNALRRILLASLEAPAILSVKVEGVPHEYTAIEGVSEDMTHIILNFKGALLRKLTTEEDVHPRDVETIVTTLEVSAEDIEKGGGQYRVTLKDVLKSSSYELVNPQHLLFTVTSPINKRIEIKIASGRGYVPSERHTSFEKGIDEIVIDSSFSPVRLVNYYVENTRVGQDTDYDRLILEVNTDGRVTPSEALNFAAQIGIMHFQAFNGLKMHALLFDKGEKQSNRDRDELLSKLALEVMEIELSVRSANCLQQADINFIGELVVRNEDDMLQYRNFGKKSLNEIKYKLQQMGLNFGMDLSEYGITKENVLEIIQEYLGKKAGGGSL